MASSAGAGGAGGARPPRNALATVRRGALIGLRAFRVATIARCVLLLFDNPPRVIARPLSKICDPFLDKFKGIRLGGTDIYPIAALVTLEIIIRAIIRVPEESGSL